MVNEKSFSKGLKPGLKAGFLASIIYLIFLFPEPDSIVFLIAGTIFGGFFGGIIPRFYDKIPGRGVFKKTLVVGIGILIILGIITGIIAFFLVQPLSETEGPGGGLGVTVGDSLGKTVVYGLLFKLVFLFILYIAWLFIYAYLFDRFLKKEV